MKPPPVINLQRNQIKDASKILSEILLDDPLYRYLIPAISKRSRFLTYFYEIELNYAFKYGDILTIGDLDGFAISLPNKSSSPSFFKMIRYGSLRFDFLRVLYELGSDFLKRYSRVSKICVDLRKNYIHAPFTLLQAIGVKREKQGQGYASPLIRRILELTAKRNELGFMVTFNPTLVDLYKKYGVLLEEYHLDGTDLVIWAFLWDPADERCKK